MPLRLYFLRTVVTGRQKDLSYASERQPRAQRRPMYNLRQTHPQRKAVEQPGDHENPILEKIGLQTNSRSILPYHAGLEAADVHAAIDGIYLWTSRGEVPKPALSMRPDRRACRAGKHALSDMRGQTFVGIGELGQGRG